MILTEEWPYENQVNSLSIEITNQKYIFSSQKRVVEISHSSQDIDHNVSLKLLILLV
jgi:hypothetical protein